MTIDRQHRWYAVQVKPRHEKSVTAAMRRRGLEEFLPLYTRQMRWSDRFKIVEFPLFPQYTFCRIKEAHFTLVRELPGVRTIVGVNGRATPVEDREIEAVRSLVASCLPLSPLETPPAGSWVRVTGGPLSGCEGVLQTFHRRQRLAVGVSLLGR